MSDVDYRKLWEGLKAELAFDVTHYDLDVFPESGRSVTTEAARNAQTFLDRMEQAETLARYVRPATPDTFARVRSELGVKV